MHMERLCDVALLAARCLIGVLFLGGAVQKLAASDAAQELLAMQGLPEVLVWPALAFNAMAGALLVLGVWVRPVAAVLALYCGFTSFFHLIPTDPWQMSIFFKNWAISGGCLALAVAGSGRYAIRADQQIPQSLK